MKYWQRAVYNSKLWEETRQLVIDRDNGICQLCNKLILGTPEVDHIEELNEENFKDMSIAFGLDNLRAVHHKCHNIRHGRFTSKEKEIIVDDDLNIDYEKGGSIWDCLKQQKE